MSLRLKREVKEDIAPLPAGTYMGVCIGIVDIGKQYVKAKNQKQGNYVPQCMFIFEIPSERVVVNGEDKPRWVSTRRLRVSADERSNLYKMLITWRGKNFTDEELDSAGQGFDLEERAGAPAMLSLSVYEGNDGRLHNGIEAVTGFPKGLPAPQPESEILVFDADEPDMEVFGKMPEWVQDIIRKSTQFADNAPEEKVEIPPEEPETPPDSKGACPI